MLIIVEAVEGSMKCSRYNKGQIQSSGYDVEDDLNIDPMVTDEVC